MEFDWKSGELAEGLACYGRGEFFETHEHWEVVWLGLEEPEKSFLQALVQVAAAMHHWKMGRPAGTISLLGRALRRLEDCPAVCGGIAVGRLREEVRGWLGAVEGVGGVVAGAPGIWVAGGTRD